MSEDGKDIFDGGTQEEFGKGDGLYSTEQKLSIYLARCLEAAGTKQQRPLSTHQIEDLERKTTFEFAQKYSLWIDDLYSLGVPLTGGGNENTLAYDQDSKTVYKSNNLFNARNSISQFIKSVLIHNELFPETKYDLVGFTGIIKSAGKVPYIEPILRQNYIPYTQQANQEDIDNYMDSLGFNKINDHTFSNTEYTISDLRPRNVLKDDDGTIYVIDDIITLNTDNKQ